VTSNNWWSQKLGGAQPRSTPPTQPYQPPQQAPVQPQQPQQPQQYAPPQQEPRTPASARQSGSCPGCGSGNYGQVTPESRARCYDCGYPITQSGTGVAGVRQPTGGAVQPAKQLSTANNFNPTTIIGHI